MGRGTSRHIEHGGTRHAATWRSQGHEESETVRAHQGRPEGPRYLDRAGRGDRGPDGQQGARATRGGEDRVASVQDRYLFRPPGRAALARRSSGSYARSAVRGSPSPRDRRPLEDEQGAAATRGGPPETPMSTIPGRRIVGTRVRAGDRDVGRVHDLLLGADLGIALGLVVESTAERRSLFLPWLSADVEPGVVAARSPTSLLGDVELSYYLECGVRRTQLAGLLATGDGHRTRVVSDALLDLPSGHVLGLLLTDGLGTLQIDLDQTRVRWSGGSMTELFVSPAGTGTASDPAAKTG